MADLYVARRTPRKALVLKQKATKKMPTLIFLLHKTERGELDELVRGSLSKYGVNQETVVGRIVDQAEEEYEKRIKVDEVNKEIRRLMVLRARGMKLMQVGFRKWKEAFYPSYNRLDKAGKTQEVT